jgi:hypothetical protein
MTSPAVSARRPGTHSRADAAEAVVDPADAVVDPADAAVDPSRVGPARCEPTRDGGLCVAPAVTTTGSTAGAGASAVLVRDRAQPTKRKPPSRRGVSADLFAQIASIHHIM